MIYTSKSRNLFLALVFFLMTNINFASTWYTKESSHFQVMYTSSLSYLSDFVLNSAERNLQQLQKIFHYQPSEKITVLLYDMYDYGFGAAATVPQNLIRIEVEPLETSYESIPYTHRINWLLSHELVHIIVNDKACGFEENLRAVFSKVYPEKEQPLTIFYSYLTNSRRYTPRWHQESIAVFLETWLNGGYGRILSSYDEMYFRSLIVNNKKIAGSDEVEKNLSQKNYLLDQVNYLYGTRFVLHLAQKYGYEKLIEWFDNTSGLYNSYECEFKKVFCNSLDNEWEDFIQAERKFQEKNIEILKSSKLSQVKYLSDEYFGSVSSPYFNSTDSSVVFSYHRQNELAELTELNLDNGKIKKLTSIPTPSLQKVSSVAFDNNGTVFFTSNNNQLYRDIISFQLESRKSRVFSENSRIGSLTISKEREELWGVKHVSGMSILVYAVLPYSEFVPIYVLSDDNEFEDIALSPDGKKLAAAIHRASGKQELLIFDVENLLSKGAVNYKTIADFGTPESPSWSHDGNYIYFNSYLNGISNIYQYDLVNDEVKVVSNTDIGLFKAIEISPRKLFCFEFSTEGFRPVVINVEEIGDVPAINYRGQILVDQEPALGTLGKFDSDIAAATYPQQEYNSLKHLDVNTFVPVISGFENKKVLGVFSRISDPMLVHDLRIHLGVSPFDEDNAGTEYHLHVHYDYKKEWEFDIEHNASDFYDLLNDRKASLRGDVYGITNTYYWTYDNPLKSKQTTSLTLYFNQSYFLDNIIQVSQPDFMVAQTEYERQYLRRSIGSVEYERGYKYSVKGLFFCGEYDRPVGAGQLVGDLGVFHSFLSQHNVFYFNLSAGYHFKNDKLYQARFFIGGFGNREVEDKDYKQYRTPFRFPGIPIYNIDTDKFVKATFENNFPPIWIGHPEILQHYPVYLDLSVFSQVLLFDLNNFEYAQNIGTQLNINFKHWHNLESTLSFGIAKAWHNLADDYECFVSLKLLKN